MRQANPDEWMWTLEAHLAATVADSLRWLQWSKSKDGQRNRNVPKLITRPGVRDDTKRYGKAESFENILEFLGDDVVADWGTHQLNA